MAKKDNFKKVFTKYAEEYLDTRIQNVFQKVALSIFDKLMREDVLFQNQTGTLTASTGIGIFKNGRMVQWVDNPNYPASQRTVTYKGQKTVVNGQKLLNATLAATDARTAGKYVMVLPPELPRCRPHSPSYTTLKTSSKVSGSVLPVPRRITQVCG